MRKPATAKTAPGKPGERIQVLKATLASAVLSTASWQAGTLTVAFHSGCIWAYDAVPIEAALMLIASESPGGYFAHWVKPKYDGRKLMEARG